MTLVNGFRDHHNGFVEADFGSRQKGWCFAQTLSRKVVGTVHEKWRCVPGIASGSIADPDSQWICISTELLISALASSILRWFSADMSQLACG